MLENKVKEYKEWHRNHRKTYATINASDLSMTVEGWKKVDF